jgi:hypothetical protein
MLRAASALLAAQPPRHIREEVSVLSRLLLGRM